LPAAGLRHVAAISRDAEGPRGGIDRDRGRPEVVLKARAGGNEENGNGVGVGGVSGPPAAASSVALAAQRGRTQRIVCAEHAI